MRILIIENADSMRESTLTSRQALLALKDKHLGVIEDKTSRTPRFVHFYGSDTPTASASPNLFQLPLMDIDDVYGPITVLCSKLTSLPKSLAELLPFGNPEMDEAYQAGWWLDEESDDELPDADEDADADEESAGTIEEADDEEPEPEEAAPPPTPAVKKPRSRATVSKALTIVNDASTKLAPVQDKAIGVLRPAFPGQDAPALQRAILRKCIVLAERMGMAPSWEDPVFEDLFRRMVYHVVKNAAKIAPLLPCDLGALLPVDIDPARWTPLRDTRLAQERQQAEDKKAGMSSITCKKCRQTGCVTYTEAQTRGGDEGMTTFYSCHNCGTVWKK